MQCAIFGRLSALTTVRCSAASSAISKCRPLCSSTGNWPDSPGVDLTLIHRRQLGPEHSDRIDKAFHTLEDVGDRLAFVRSPFNLENAAATADAIGADLIVLDYIQRIPPPGEHGDRRGSIDKTMDFLRQFADQEMALIADRRRC